MRRRTASPLAATVLAGALTLALAPPALAQNGSDESKQGVRKEQPAQVTRDHRSRHSDDVQYSSHRLGTVRHRRHSASGLGAGSFLLGGPVGWGIYRAVDNLRR